MSPNRIVALLTPVCALAAGWVASWIAQNFPDADISKESLQAVFIGGMLAVIAPAAQWLHGWQKYEERLGAADQIATVVDAAGAESEPDLDDLALADDDDLDDLEEELAEFDDVAAEDEEPVPAG